MYDGVIHIPASVIIPPKTINGVVEQYKGEDLTVEEFKARFEGLVEDEKTESFEL